MSRLNKCSRNEMDIISDLPWDVLNIILVRLPLREAARTSVLSTKWRYKWTGLSQYIFDDKCFANSLSDPVARWGEIMEIMDKIRPINSGPIHKFELASYCSPDYSDLDQWILFLTEKGIKEFILREFLFVKRYKLPCCLFSCPQLNHLLLYGCIIKLPSLFNGFKCLKSLQLNQVSINGDTLQSLILNCPVLERLTLLNITHLGFLKINAQKLKYLRIYSEFEDICLENSLLLASVDIHLIVPFRGRVIRRHSGQGKDCNLVRVFNRLSSIERLTLANNFLQFLANDNVPAKCPTMLSNLVALELKDLRFNFKEISASFSIFKSSPNLEQLVISVFHSHDVLSNIVEYIKAECESDFYFAKLKVVKIRGIRGSATEREFFKFILGHSPVLKDFTIVKYEGEWFPVFVLKKYECASKDVKITSLCF